MNAARPLPWARHKPTVRNPSMVHSSDVQHVPIAEFVPELDRLAVDAMTDWKVPGAALAVVQDGKVAASRQGEFERERLLAVGGDAVQICVRSRAGCDFTPLIGNRFALTYFPPPISSRVEPQREP